MARVLHYLVAVAVAVTVNFALPRLMPGSPLAAIAGTDIATLTAADRETLVAQAGLDQPLHRQYARYLASVVRLDLGHSYQRHAPVAAVLAERLPWTLLLLVASQGLSLLLGVALGALAAWHRGRLLDRAVLASVVVSDALPVFWIAMVLLAVFAVQVPWFPLYGAVSPWAPSTGIARLYDIARHAALPVATMVIGSLAGTFLVARASMAAVLDRPFLHAARARGIGGLGLVTGHVLPNALLPIVTASAVGVGLSIGGTPLVETVFSYPGIGRLVHEAVQSRDYPVLQGAFLVITTVAIAANAVADALHGLIDPRLRQGEDRQ